MSLQKFNIDVFKYYQNTPGKFVPAGTQIIVPVGNYFLYATEYDLISNLKRKYLLAVFDIMGKSGIISTYSLETGKTTDWFFIFKSTNVVLPHKVTSSSCIMKKAKLAETTPVIIERKKR